MFGLPVDKTLHALVGAVLFLLCLLGGSPPMMAVALVAIVGAGKEAYDSLHPEAHTADPLDLVATVAPAVLGWLLLGPMGLHPPGWAA